MRLLLWGALVAVPLLGLASGRVGVGAQGRAVRQPHVIGAFASQHGVGLVDRDLRVRMLGRRDSSDLTWDEGGDLLAWVEYLHDDQYVVVQASAASHHVVRSIPVSYPGKLAWVDRQLYVDAAPGLGQVSASGAVTWQHRKDWYDDASRVGASLAGAVGGRLLATYTSDEVSGYGGPQSLEVVPPGGGRAETLYAYQSGENGIVNLPIGHVVGTRDGAVFLATGTRGGACSMYVELDRLVGGRLDGTPALAADVPDGDSHDVEVWGLRTDASRTHLFVDVVAMGAECPTTRSSALRTYELDRTAWRRVTTGSSTSRVGTSVYSATLVPAVDPHGGGLGFGNPSPLWVQRPGAAPLVVQGVTEFVWAGAQAG